MQQGGSRSLKANHKVNTKLRSYLVVTGGYWAFTLTDGAIRMLVVLYFHSLGFSPLEVAGLFVFYEFFGIVTNLVGGWLGARVGLERTMWVGMALQVFALASLAAPEVWLTVPYVMAAQALSGIAKDLNKMSAKASVKHFSTDSSESLFRWVAVLTGSKNTLKGVGFFLGALLLDVFGYRSALLILAVGLGIVLIVTMMMLPPSIGKMKSKPKFSEMFSLLPAINTLSAARFFLFGARDIWFVIALPVYLSSVSGWSHSAIGSFMAIWVIAYGVVQASAPKLLRKQKSGGPDARSAFRWVAALSVIPAGIAIALGPGQSSTTIIVAGLMVFGFVFAINSAVHSFLILKLSDTEKVSLNVGFYYMSNAGGRLVGTVLSGLIGQFYSLEGCLWVSSLFLVFASLITYRLSRVR